MCCDLLLWDFTVSPWQTQNISCEKLTWLTVLLHNTEVKVVWINSIYDSHIMIHRFTRVQTPEYTWIGVKFCTWSTKEQTASISQFTFQTSLPFICDQHCSIARVECLQSAHSIEIHSDFMEKCWFSQHNCTRLFSALLTRAVGREDWKLVGRSISLDCFHLQTCSLHTLFEYTTSITSLWRKLWRYMQHQWDQTCGNRV